MRDTREVINKSEGAVVSVSISLNRIVVQKEWKAARVWGGRHAKKNGGRSPSWVFIPTARNMRG